MLSEAGLIIKQAIHQMYLGIGVSNASATLTYFSGITLGNTRLDIYANKATAVIGQPTATVAALSLVGAGTTLGVADAAIDQVGIWYADGKIGGVYGLLGITGREIPLATSRVAYSPSFHVQFGDR